MDNNLCLYCGKARHKAIECKAPLNKRPGTKLRKVDTVSEEEIKDTKSAFGNFLGQIVFQSNLYLGGGQIEIWNSSLQKYLCLLNTLILQPNKHCLFRWPVTMCG